MMKGKDLQMLSQDEMNDWLQFKLNCFNYLDELRESGETNMFGARPYLMQEFDISKNEATDILSEWMKAYRA